jgi:HSP20 family protein
MMRLLKIKILRDFDRLEDRVRRWVDNIYEFQESGHAFRPPVDFFETSQGLVLRMEVAGVAKEDLSLTMSGQELVIRGRRRPSQPQGLVKFLCHEISHGYFERRFHVPLAVDASALQARYRDGILEVVLPRATSLSRRIPVREVPENE